MEYKQSVCCYWKEPLGLVACGEGKSPAGDQEGKPVFNVEARNGWHGALHGRVGCLRTVLCTFPTWGYRRQYACALHDPPLCVLFRAWNPRMGLVRWSFGDRETCRDLKKEEAASFPSSRKTSWRFLLSASTFSASGTEVAILPGRFLAPASLKWRTLAVPFHKQFSSKGLEQEPLAQSRDQSGAGVSTVHIRRDTGAAIIGSLVFGTTAKLVGGGWKTVLV